MTDNYLNGIPAGSINEVYLYNALVSQKISFDYQVPIMGGRWSPFGQVVDFVCYLPYAQPVQVFGPHWHTGHLGALDGLKLALLENYYRRPVLVVWSTEIESQEQADQWVRSHIR